ncbi:MAG: flagellin, partial [Thermoplasmatota archaeon]
IGTMIIFIAMILVAGIAASVLLQTMDGLEGQAMKTGKETMDDISSGIKVTQVTGVHRDGKITQIALFLSPIAGSNDIDLSMITVSISDANKNTIFSYNQSCFTETINDGLFQSINTSLLAANEFGLVVIRDSDQSCLATNPVIDTYDIVSIVINTTKAFSGLSPRTKVQGVVSPEMGMSGTVRFTTPSCFSDRIIQLQP